MSVCPVCAFESNHDMECQNCGLRLEDDALLSSMEVESMEGLELTLQSASTGPVNDSSMSELLESSGAPRRFKANERAAPASRCRMCGVVAVYDRRCRQCGERQSDNSGDNA